MLEMHPTCWYSTSAGKGSLWLPFGSVSGGIEVQLAAEWDGKMPAGIETRQATQGIPKSIYP
jgi:hypothetical protein